MRDRRGGGELIDRFPRELKHASSARRVRAIARLDTTCVEEIDDLSRYSTPRRAPPTSNRSAERANGVDRIGTALALERA